MTTKKITSEDRKWALDNLGQAMKDLDNDSPEYDQGATVSMKSKNYEIETIDQREGHYKKRTIRNVANMIESVHYFIFITTKACVIKRRRDTWRWAK